MRHSETNPTVLPLRGGLRLVHIHDRHTRAAIFGVSVRAGSRDESPDCYGLAHFVEHTIFKGTKRRSSWHIINRMESVGGELNAYTTKEATVIYSIFPAQAMTRAAELIADLVLNSRFPEKELEKERQVVLDEINSYLDSPADAVYDDFEDLLFAGTPLGHNILGTPESVAALTGADCRAFLDRHYHAPDMVAFYSGPASAERVAAAVERHFAGLPGEDAPKRDQSACLGARFNSERALPIHQSHVVAGCVVPADTYRQRYASSLLSNITGGPGMNSLLNVELRERRGLVYGVEAGTTFFGNTGLSTVYFGCDEEDRNLCLSLCRRVFTSIADGSALTQLRLERARKQYLGQLAVAVENRENRILAAARATLFHGAPRTDAEVEADIRAVTRDDLATLAAQMLEASVLSFIPN